MRSVHAGGQPLHKKSEYRRRQPASIIPVEEKTVRFDGWHSHHDFECVPQISALEDQSIVLQVLANAEYWQQRALKQE